jgi:hypothetical protein
VAATVLLTIAAVVEMVAPEACCSTFARAAGMVGRSQ